MSMANTSKRVKAGNRIELRGWTDG